MSEPIKPVGFISIPAEPTHEIIRAICKAIVKMFGTPVAPPEGEEQ